MDRLLYLLTLAFLLTTSSVANAIAPVLDFRDDVGDELETRFFQDCTLGSEGLPGCADAINAIGADNLNGGIIIVVSVEDMAEATPSPGGPAVGFLYLDYDVAAGAVELTTFYGTDLDPLLDDESAIIGGVDPVAPQFEVLSETFFGASQSFPADSLGTFAVGDLSEEPLFAGLEFDRFGGDPTGLVYAFRAVAPIDEFLTVVPEPTGLTIIGLLATGGLMLRRH